MSRTLPAAYMRPHHAWLALLVLVLLSIDAAFAVEYPDQGLAKAACLSAAARHPGMFGGARVTTHCERLGDFPQVTCYGYSANGVNVIGCAGQPHAYSWPVGRDCKARSSYTGVGPWSSIGGGAKTGSYGCRDGCDGQWDKNADSTYTWTAIGDSCSDDEKSQCERMGGGRYWNALLKVCEPPNGECVGGGKPNSLGQCAPEPCPDGMAQQPDGTCKKKENECPAGNVRSPDGKCLPGEGQCAAGEVRGPDGTCKRDRDGDGQPDPPGEGGEGEGEQEAFAGGDDCSVPPSCSGSPILCGQARIQWRIDCNTRKNRNIAGGTCAAMPTCTGEKCDALEYSSLVMQWRSACALEKLERGDNSGDNGIKDHLTAMKQAEVNGLRALGQDDGHGNVDPSKIWGDANVKDRVNEGLFGGGGGLCDLSFTIGGEVVSPSPQFWRIVQLIHWLMVASAYLWVSYQLSK